MSAPIRHYIYEVSDKVALQTKKVVAKLINPLISSYKRKHTGNIDEAYVGIVAYERNLKFLEEMTPH
jgi:hypothetical protein